MRLAVALCFFFSASLAQTASIKGKVLDASTKEPLPFCNIFIDNSTMGATSDRQGNFEIRNVPIPGIYEMIYSYVGYESYVQKLNLADSLVTLRSMFLKPSQTVLNSVEVTGSRDKNWEKKFKKFNKIFLGDDKEADQCTITNPWVIDFADGDGPNLVAKASSPIEIENKALGYKVKFFLVDFAASSGSYRFTGKSFFDEITPTSYEQRDAWRKARSKAYFNSKQHLFKAIVDKRIKGEGYELYTEVDGIVDRNVRSTKFYSVLGSLVKPYDTTNLVVNDARPGVFRIQIDGRMEIHYMRESDYSSIYRDVLHPVSWIDVPKKAFLVDRNGFEIHSASVITSGTMNRSRIAHLLPIDYRPPAKTKETEPLEDISHLEENIYVHTDKPYYYPHETIWFKGYIRYRSLSLRDSLSKTVYAELIGPDKKVRVSKTLEVRNGAFYNQFSLPDTLSEGAWYLRCYTNLNRNFGDNDLYTKLIPILDLKQAVGASMADTVSFDNGVLSIETKDVFRTHEKVELKLVPKGTDTRWISGARLSISVTDIRQVVPFTVSGPISDGLEFRNTRARSRTLYPIEYGVGFTGRFQTDQPNHTETVLNVIQLMPRHYTMTQADANGRFVVSGLSFYDSAYFTIVPTGGKNKPQGTTTILPREIPAVHLPGQVPDVVIEQTELPQRDIAFLTSNIAVAKEIPETTSILVDEPNEHRPMRPYGKPDEVVLAKDFGAGQTNLLTALQGRFGGLVVRQTNNRNDIPQWKVYLNRNAAGSSGIPPEVLVTVNDNMMAGTPEQILSVIDVRTVESVELKRGTYADYGGGGGRGILSVYTKAASAEGADEGAIEKISVKGYDRPGRFQSPDYGATSTSEKRKDYRSTIYWNPDVVLDDFASADLSFYAAGLPGQYKIVVEGIAKTGEPIRAEKVLTITEQ